MLLGLKETNISTKQNRVKNPKWLEADQLAYYKHDRRAELGSTQKQLQLSGQSGIWTRPRPTDFKFAALLGHIASLLL